MTSAFAGFVSFVLDELAQLGAMLMLFADIVRTAFTRRPRWRETMEQTYKIGWQSQAVVLITGAFTGMVFAVQTLIQFHKVKMDTAVGPVVSIAMARELAPVLTALTAAGRVGAAIAAELGTMKVTEQLDALRAMGTAPVDYLAVPRFVALVVALLAAFRHPRLCPFYYRPVAAGKPPKVALVAVMRKLIILLNRVLQDPTFQPA